MVNASRIWASFLEHQQEWAKETVSKWKDMAQKNSGVKDHCMTPFSGLKLRDFIEVVMRFEKQIKGDHAL